MKSTVKLSICIVISCLLLFSFAAAASAKPTLTISFYKNDGYGMGNDKQGVWTINTAVSENTTHVEFYLDDNLELNDTEAPFSWTFDTGNYTLGLHTIKVVAYDSTGESASVEEQPNFVGFPWNFFIGLAAFLVVIFVVVLAISAYKIKKDAKKRRAQNS